MHSSPSLFVLVSTLAVVLVACGDASTETSSPPFIVGHWVTLGGSPSHLYFAPPDESGEGAYVLDESNRRVRNTYAVRKVSRDGKSVTFVVDGNTYEVSRLDVTTGEADATMTITVSGKGDDFTHRQSLHRVDDLTEPAATRNK